MFPGISKELKKVITKQVFQKCDKCGHEEDAEELFINLAAELGYDIDHGKQKRRKPKKPKEPKLTPRTQDHVDALIETRKGREDIKHSKRAHTWCAICAKFIGNRYITEHKEAHRLRGE